MSRSRSRLAADWFAKLRVNAQTQKLEHEDIVTVESEVTAVSTDVATTVTNQLSAVSTDVSTKLDATSYTAEDVLAKVKTVDGSGSGLDADTLDGQHASAFQPAGSYLTGNQTITLTGDVSGSGTTSIAVTIADDSHNHIIANVDGLQAALNGKLSTSGKAADSNLLDGIDSSAFVRNNNGNQSVSGGFFTNSGLGSSGSNTMAANIGTAAITWNHAQLELRNTDAGRVGMTFHRSGYTEISLSHYTAGLLELNGSFTASGNVTAYSDERLKSNIQTIEGAVDTVKALRGVTFEKDGKASLGVIAQEVQKVLPEVVQEGEEYLSVAYGNIVGLLIEAIKEQQTQIDELKAKLEG